MSQTSVTTLPSESLLGMIYDSEESDIIYRQANAAVYLGLLCQFDASNMAGAGEPGMVKEITDSATSVPNWAGIPVWIAGKEPYPVANSKSQIADKGQVSLMRKGRIWVYVETAVDVTSDPWFRVLASGSDVKGQFRAGTAANFVQASASGLNAKFITKTTGAGLAVLEIR